MKELPFRLTITDDGSGQFALDYKSLDGVYCADSSHEGLDAAFATAERQFGIGRSEWIRHKS